MPISWMCRRFACWRKHFPQAPLFQFLRNWQRILRTLNSFWRTCDRANNTCSQSFALIVRLEISVAQRRPYSHMKWEHGLFCLTGYSRTTEIEKYKKVIWEVLEIFWSQPVYNWPFFVLTIRGTHFEKSSLQLTLWEEGRSNSLRILEPKLCKIRVRWRQKIFLNFALAMPFLGCKMEL